MIKHKKIIIELLVPPPAASWGRGGVRSKWGLEILVYRTPADDHVLHPNYDGQNPDTNRAGKYRKLVTRS